MNKQKLYKCVGVLWEVATIPSKTFITPKTYCPQEGCRARLVVEIGDFICDACGFTKEYQQSFNELQAYVDRIFQGKLRENWEVVSLDLPPGAASSTDLEDDTYWVKARVGQKRGKKTAVIYIGEKLSREQNPDDYVQMFVDVEDSQLRFDKSNKDPLRLLTKVEAEFEDARIEVDAKTN